MKVSLLPEEIRAIILDYVLENFGEDLGVSNTNEIKASGQLFEQDYETEFSKK